MTVWKTKEQALRDFGLVFAEWREHLSHLTAWQAAEEARTLDHPMTLDELAEYIASLGICRAPHEVHRPAGSPRIQ